MRLKYLFFTFLLLISIKMVSQNWNHYNWKDTTKLDDTVFEKAKNLYVSQYKDHIYMGDLIEQEANSNLRGFYSDYIWGNIYPSFYGYETYVKSVLCQVLKDTSQTNKIKIYFYYEPELNVTMDAFGNIRVYVGLFNYINNEAELAGILGHEFGHFFNKDGINEHTESIQRESAADYFSINLIKNSPYSTKGMSNVFKTFKRLEIKKELKYGKNAFNEDRSHPDPGDRLKQVKILAKDSINIGKKLYVVDSVKFHELKKIASQEAFNIMVGYNMYSSIIELAFRNYLYAPNDMENLALLNESLRRLLVENPSLENKQFIINSYKGKGSKKSSNYKYVDDDNTSILNYLNKGLLLLPSGDLSKIVAKELLDSVNLKFTTYKEAYNFFAQKSKECKPCLFSNELVFKKTTETSMKLNTVFDCNTFLQDINALPSYSNDIYIINQPNMNGYNFNDENQRKDYYDFVDTIVKQIKEKLNVKNVILMKELSFYDKHLLSFVDNYSENIVDPFLYERAIYANAQCHRTGYINLVNNQHITKKEKLDWLYTNPEFYDVFKKYNAKTFYFIDFDLLDIEARYSGGYGFSVGSRVNTSKSWQFKKVSMDNKKENVIYHHSISITKESKETCLMDCISQLKWFLSSNK